MQLRTCGTRWATRVMLIAATAVVASTTVWAPQAAFADSDTLAPVSAPSLTLGIDDPVEQVYAFPTTVEVQAPPGPVQSTCHPDGVAYAGYQRSGGSASFVRLQAFAAGVCQDVVSFVSAKYTMLKDNVAVHSEYASCTTSIPAQRLCTNAQTSGVNDSRGTWTCTRTATVRCSATYQIRYDYEFDGLLPTYPPYVPGHSCNYDTFNAVTTCRVYSGKFTV